MKNSPNKFFGNKLKNINSLKNKAPDVHDDPQRRQPPTPQDIQRVQKISQRPQKSQMRTGAPKGKKGA